MTLRRRFDILFRIQFAFAVGLATLTVSLYLNQRKLSHSRDTHFQSYLLADELRQSSDDLTRLARTYVATGDERYERQYWAVLAIRNGKSPRPVAYHRIYWDLVSGTGQRPRPDGPAISLRDLMKQEGFTDAELEKLTESQNHSDGLVKAETIAMNAAKGLFDDGAGNFTVKKQPDRVLATRLMNDEAYHRNKVSIMEPIDEFYTMLAHRTAGEVAKFERRSMHLLLLTGGMIVVVVVIFAFSVVSLRRQLTEHEEASIALAEQYRSKAGQAALNAKMRGDLTLDKLAANVISFLCEHLRANVGALYICTEDHAARLVGSYALPQHEGIAREIHPGEGLVGQVLVQKKPIGVTDCPEKYITIRSSFGSAGPKTILLYPLLLNDAVEVVLEFAAFKEFSESDLSFLEATADNIAITLRTAVGRSRREELLERTQLQKEELQTQQEELRAANEELEEQTRALRATEDVMKAYQEELLATNEELTKHESHL
jgi:hypothetical protein